jgi:hypothetical protein
MTYLFILLVLCFLFDTVRELTGMLLVLGAFLLLLVLALAVPVFAIAWLFGGMPGL